MHASDLEELAVGSDDRPLLMTADSPAEPVKRDIAFRLTALRDTQNYNIARQGCILNIHPCTLGPGIFTVSLLKVIEI